LLHCPIGLKRDQQHQFVSFEDGSSQQDDLVRQTVFFIEVDRQTSKLALEQLTDELMSVVKDVSIAVQDWQPMRARLRDIIKEFKTSKCPISVEQKDQTENFLAWLNDHNFTLMGYRSYSATGIKGDYRWVADNDTSLGLMKNSKTNRDRVLSNIPATAREEALSSNPLMLTKTNSRSRVHRPAYLDYVGIKRFDDAGMVIGEDRFIGLYSASFYNSSATQ
jgi:glutamate dehydrogenase